jgi:hypothetical protein
MMESRGRNPVEDEPTRGTYSSHPTVENIAMNWDRHALLILRIRLSGLRE